MCFDNGALFEGGIDIEANIIGIENDQTYEELRLRKFPHMFEASFGHEKHKTREVKGSSGQRAFGERGKRKEVKKSKR